jgi:hypothetical protein
VHDASAISLRDQLRKNQEESNALTTKCHRLEHDLQCATQKISQLEYAARELQQKHDVELESLRGRGQLLAAEAHAYLPSESDAVAYGDSDERLARDNARKEQESAMQQMEVCKAAIANLDDMYHRSQSAHAEELRNMYASLEAAVRAQQDLEIELVNSKASLKSLDFEYSESAKEYERMEALRQEEAENLRDEIKASKVYAEQLSVEVDELRGLRGLHERSNKAELRLVDTKSSTLLKEEIHVQLKQQLLEEQRHTQKYKDKLDEAEQSLSALATAQAELRASVEISVLELRKDFAHIQEENGVLMRELDTARRTRAHSDSVLLSVAERLGCASHEEAALLDGINQLSERHSIPTPTQNSHQLQPIGKADSVSVETSGGMFLDYATYSEMNLIRAEACRVRELLSAHVTGNDNDDDNGNGRGAGRKDRSASSMQQKKKGKRKENRNGEKAEAFTESVDAMNAIVLSCDAMIRQLQNLQSKGPEAGPAATQDEVRLRDLASMQISVEKSHAQIQKLEHERAFMAKKIAEFSARLLAENDRAGSSDDDEPDAAHMAALPAAVSVPVSASVAGPALEEMKILFQAVLSDRRRSRRLCRHQQLSLLALRLLIERKKMHKNHTKG